MNYKMAKFIVGFLIIGGWFLGFILSVKFTSYPGEPWFIYYLILTATVMFSLKFAFTEDDK